MPLSSSTLTNARSCWHIVLFAQLKTANVLVFSGPFSVMPLRPFQQYGVTRAKVTVSCVSAGRILCTWMLLETCKSCRTACADEPCSHVHVKKKVALSLHTRILGLQILLIFSLLRAGLIKQAIGSDTSLLWTWHLCIKGGPWLLGWAEALLEATRNDWRGWFFGPKIKDQQCRVLDPKISPNTNLGPQ